MKRLEIPGIVLAVFAASVFVHGHAQEVPVQTPDIVSVTDPRDGYPDISPDGKYIVFQSNRSGTWQLWLVEMDGSVLRRLTQTDANDTMPVWSPDGSKIMFVSDRAGNSVRDIYVLDFSDDVENPETSVKRIVGTDGDDMHPEWADDGKKIVFNRIYSTGDGADIIIANADGRDGKIVKTDRGWNTYAAMTPDTERLIWRGSIEETADGETVQNSEIFNTRPDGTDRVRLTNNSAFDGWPAISRDGAMVAFASNRIGGVFNIYVIPINGGAPRQLTFGESINYTQPAWSADGKKLVAFRWLEDEVAEIGHIVLLNAEAKDR